MPDALASLDQSLFHLLNVQWANPVFDQIMPVITNDWLLRILLGIALVTMLLAGFRRFRLIVLTALLLVGVADLTASRLLKPLFDRPRPCQTQTEEHREVHLLVPCGSGKSMPSSHATNCFAVAVFFALLYSRWRWPLLAGATLVAFSRVAVGVHYPGDVLAGALVGSLLAAVAVLILTRLAPQTVVESLRQRHPRHVT